jgi:hypothetical protein
MSGEDEVLRQDEFGDELETTHQRGGSVGISSPEIRSNFIGGTS